MVHMVEVSTNPDLVYILCHIHMCALNKSLKVILKRKKDHSLVKGRYSSLRSSDLSVQNSTNVPVFLFLTQQKLFKSGLQISLQTW